MFIGTSAKKKNAKKITMRNFPKKSVYPNFITDKRSQNHSIEKKFHCFAGLKI